LAESAVTDTISGESAAAEPSEEAAPVDHEASSHKEGSFQKESETGPTNLKVAEQAAQVYYNDPVHHHHLLIHFDRRAYCQSRQPRPRSRFHLEFS